MSFAGFLGDWIKVKKRHNRGIFEAEKLHHDVDEFPESWWLVAATGIEESISNTSGDLGFEAASGGFSGRDSSFGQQMNAVNVTDGLDGLAGGSALMGFGAFMIISYRHFETPIYSVVNLLDMGVLAASFAGVASASCGGTQPCPNLRATSERSPLERPWPPALTLNTHLLLILICGINVVEAGSVAIHGRVQTLGQPAECHRFTSHFSQWLARDNGDHSFLAAIRWAGRACPCDFYWRLHCGGR